MSRPDELWSAVEQALLDGSCLATTLSKRRAEAVDAPEKLTVRPTTVKGGRVYQWAARRGNRETHENLSPQLTVERLHDLLRTSYEHAHVFTRDADFEVRMRPDGRLNIRRTGPSKTAAPLPHDRVKAHLIPEHEPCRFLAEIGVMTPAGKVRASRQGKYRQISRFLELVDDVVDQLPESGVLRIVDFGCGKSSLTFALHHLLTRIHARQVDLLGVDRNADVIDACNDLQKKLRCEGLEFRVGEISDLEIPGPVDLCVSLHACDTATDDALARAVGWQARVILAVPCCQHELAGRVRVEGLASLHRQGALHERFSSLATDALRAQALEACGYKTQVIEFVDMEHTAKNLLIRAVRRPPGDRHDESAREAYEGLKRSLAVQRAAADRILSAKPA